MDFMRVNVLDFQVKKIGKNQLNGIQKQPIMIKPESGKILELLSNWKNV